MSGTSLNFADFNFLDHIILDSGATNHMFGNKNLLTQFKKLHNQ
jgi:hypothetical protein